MKTFILTLLFSLPVLAQNNFRAENGAIIWERSFPAGSTDIAVLLETQSAIKVNVAVDNQIKGIAKDLKIEGDGGTTLMKSNCNFDFDIALEGDHYIVRIANFKFLEKVGPLQMRTMVSSWEKYFMDNRKIRPTPVTQGNLQYLDEFLSGVFSGTVITSSGAITAN